MCKFLFSLLFVGLSGACEEREPLASPDAGPPSCSSIGCPNVAFCDQEGLCSCLASGEAISCLRDVDAGQ